MGRIKLPQHRFRFGGPGNWQFRLYDIKTGQETTAFGFYMQLGIWSVQYLRPFVCRLLKTHVPARYSTLPEYNVKDSNDNYLLGPVCLRCNRMI